MAKREFFGGGGGLLDATSWRGARRFGNVAWQITF